MSFRILYVLSGITVYFISNLTLSQDHREQSMPTTTVLLMKGKAAAAIIKNISNIN